MYNNALMEQRLRLFIAISLPSDLQAALVEITAPLITGMGSSVRWVKSPNLHITLKFLGEVDQGKLNPLRREMAQVASEFAPMELSFQGWGVFPGWKNPRIIWTGIQAPPQLNTLSATLEAELRALGFRAEERPFSPHLTLGRVNETMTRDQKALLQQWLESSKSGNYGTLRVDHITLFRSDLRRGGPLYTELSRANFSNLPG